MDRIADGLDKNECRVERLKIFLLEVRGPKSGIVFFSFLFFSIWFSGFGFRFFQIKFNLNLI